MSWQYCNDSKCGMGLDPSAKEALIGIIICPGCGEYNEVQGTDHNSLRAEALIDLLERVEVLEGALARLSKEK